MEIVEYILTVWSRVRGWYPVTMGDCSYRCDPDHHAFWKKVNSGLWEPQTFSVFDRLLTPDTLCCDIGAWIGPTVLYAAKRCVQVYCFEPDRVAYRYLLQNIQLNRLDNVLPFNMALSMKNGFERMASPRGKRGDSMTSLLRPDGAGGMDVPCLTWQTWLELAGMPAFDVIKMDIEGGEFGLLPTMTEYLANHAPKVYLSLHPHLLPEEERFMAMGRIVESLGIYRHCYDKEGRRLPLASLLEGQQVHTSGTYLLLPE